MTVIGTESVTRQAGPDLLQLIETSLADDKAIEPVTVDLSGKTSIADAMVIATGTSQRHLAAMAQHLLERLKAAPVLMVRLSVATNPNDIAKGSPSPGGRDAAPLEEGRR